MTTRLAFWVLMLLWLVLCVGGTQWPGPYLFPVSQIFLFALLLLLGWNVFGAPLRKG